MDRLNLILILNNKGKEMQLELKNLTGTSEMKQSYTAFTRLPFYSLPPSLTLCFQ